MTLAFDTTEKRKDIVAAIHQADQTARPQVVSTDFNPKYHRLLKIYEQQTEFGGLLNTSFNLHGEPNCMFSKKTRCTLSLTAA